jgi:hypothetical protein
MNVRWILIAMVAGLVLPLAAANARTVFDPSLTPTGAGAEFERGAAPRAGNFGRDEDENKGDNDKDHDGDKDHQGDHDRQCDKSPSTPW